MFLIPLLTTEVVAKGSPITDNWIGRVRVDVTSCSRLPIFLSPSLYSLYFRPAFGSNPGSDRQSWLFYQERNSPGRQVEAVTSYQSCYVVQSV